MSHTLKYIKDNVEVIVWGFSRQMDDSKKYTMKYPLGEVKWRDITSSLSGNQNQSQTNWDKTNKKTIKKISAYL